VTVVYLDNNATTQIAPEVRAEMEPLLGELYANPSSMHSFAGRAGALVSLARERVALGLGCAPEEIVFTSGGTEGDNAAIRAALAARPERPKLVTTRVEHPAVLNVAKLEQSAGRPVAFVGVDRQGRLDLEELAAAVGPDTALVSVMLANNETGVVFPILEAAEIAKRAGALLHVDAVQALGKIPLSLADLPADYLVVSGHKVHGPKGVGALFVRRGAPFRPLIVGGHQERGRRGGTENTAGIVGLGKAVDLAVSGLATEAPRMAALRDRLEKGLLAAIPDAIVNGDPESRLPNTLSVAFKYVEGEAMLLMLDELGVCASSGSACTSGSLEPSHVLRAMGVPFTFAHGSLRFSLSRATTDQEIDLVLAELPGIIAGLREMSPFRDGDEGLGCATERSTV